MTGPERVDLSDGLVFEVAQHWSKGIGLGFSNAHSYVRYYVSEDDLRTIHRVITTLLKAL